MSEKRILVTGGAGFIGGHICERLLAEGHEVTILDNLDPYYDPALKKRNLGILFEGGNAPEFVQGDVCDLGLVNKLCEGKDIIFHEAAQAGVRISVDDPFKAYHVNTEGTLNILKAAVDKGVEKVINASSSSVYGKVEYLPFDEEHPKSPISPYGVSKLAAEHYTKVFADLYGIKTANLRYFTVYGPRMRPDLAISIFTRNALVGEPIDIYGSGEKTRDFTYIDDIVAANMLLMEKGSGDYNIGYGQRISVNELAKTILELTGSSSEVIHSGDKKGDVEHTGAKVDKAKKELGWEPKVDLREGLRRFVEYVKDEPA